MTSGATLGDRDRRDRLRSRLIVSVVRDTARARVRVCACVCVCVCGCVSMLERAIRRRRYQRRQAKEKPMIFQTPPLVEDADELKVKVWPK